MLYRLLRHLENLMQCFRLDHFGAPSGAHNIAPVYNTLMGIVMGKKKHMQVFLPVRREQSRKLHKSV